jgi:hypothetical protein
MFKAKVSICIVFILLLITNLKAQENSPYSRFGVGNLYSGYPVNLAGYGGLTAASEGPTMLNYANPASYGSLQLTTLSTGVYFNDTYLTSMSPSGGTTSQGFQSGSLTNLCLAFPVIKGHWGASFGLVPYSTQAYSVAQLDNPSVGYNSYNSFQDSGSLYKFYVGNGFQFKLDTFNRINIGFNVAYLFGTLSQSDELAFVDTFNAYNSQNAVTKTMGGVVVQGGFQYLKGFKNGARLVFGVQGSLKTSVPGYTTNVWDRWVFQDIGNNGVKDTIEGVYNQRGSMVLPATIDVGIVYDNPSHFTIGFNWDYTDWSQFSSFGETTDDPNVSLIPSWRVAIGGQLLPDAKNYQSYFKTIRYSAGFYVEQTDLDINGMPIIQKAFTLGASFPLTHGPLFTRFSSLNLALEVGQRGTIQNSLLREDYFTLSVGLTLNDLWFQKRKFE